MSAEGEGAPTAVTVLRARDGQVLAPAPMITLQQKDLEEGLARAQERGRAEKEAAHRKAIKELRDQAKREKDDALKAQLTSLADQHAAELARVREADRLAFREELRHRLQGARLWSVLATLIASILTLPALTFLATRTLLDSGVDVGMDAMAKGRVLDRVMDGAPAAAPDDGGAGFEAPEGYTRNPVNGRALREPADAP